MKNPGRMVIWPANIDVRKSRKKGRKIRRSESVESPRLPEMAAAAESLSLNPETVENAALPCSWWERTGYLLVDKAAPRGELVRRVAKEVKAMRASKKT